MSVGSLFLWFVGGWVFSLVFFLPVWAFRLIRNLIATAADDLRGS